ncbi:hypothetical protein U1Q18_052539 [Sarracenia purpurea var. burkii]
MTQQTMFRIRYLPNLDCSFTGGICIQLEF